MAAVLPPDQQPPLQGAVEPGAMGGPHAEIDPGTVATVELDRPPASQETETNQIPPEMRAKKGQVAFNVFKMAAVILTAPITAPFAACYMLGVAIESFSSSSAPGEFKEKVGEGFREVMKPLSKPKDEVLGGLIGLRTKEGDHIYVTGKVYRGAVKEEKFQQLLFQRTEEMKKEKAAGAPETEDEALQREEEAAARNLGQPEAKAREFLEERAPPPPDDEMEL